MLSFFLCIILLSTNVFGTDVCPINCVCVETEVTCQGLMSFPSTFPSNIEKVKITDSRMEKIPALTIESMPNIMSIEISSSSIQTIARHAFLVGGGVLEGKIVFENVTIGVIESQAFEDMSLGLFRILNSSIDTISPKAFDNSLEIEEFSVSHSNIKVIEEHAFSNMWDLGKFEIQSSNIGIVKSQAFSDMNYVEDMSIENVNMSVIEQSAFYKLNLGGSFTFSNNSIGNMHADSFRDFFDEELVTKLTLKFNIVKKLKGQMTRLRIAKGVDTEIFQNTVPCSCKLYKSLNYISQYDQLLISNLCYDKRTNARYSLDTYKNICLSDKVSLPTQTIDVVTKMSGESDYLPINGQKTQSSSSVSNVDDARVKPSQTKGSESTFENNKSFEFTKHDQRTTPGKEDQHTDIEIDIQNNLGKYNHNDVIVPMNDVNDDVVNDIVIESAAATLNSKDRTTIEGNGYHASNIKEVIINSATETGMTLTHSHHGETDSKPEVSANTMKGYTKHDVDRVDNGLHGRTQNNRYFETNISTKQYQLVNSVSGLTGKDESKVAETDRIGQSVKISGHQLINRSPGTESSVSRNMERSKTKAPITSTPQIRTYTTKSNYSETAIAAHSVSGVNSQKQCQIKDQFLVFMSLILWIVFYRL